MNLIVYYIDDEIELCEIFCDFFESNNVKVYTFTDPEKALEHAIQVSPDLLFIDYRLQSTTGDKVAAKFDSKIPKYLITGDLLVKTDFPFQGVFAKPYDIEAIGQSISGFVGSKI